MPMKKEGQRLLHSPQKKRTPGTKDFFILKAALTKSPFINNRVHIKIHITIEFTFREFLALIAMFVFEYSRGPRINARQAGMAFIEDTGSVTSPQMRFKVM